VATYRELERKGIDFQVVDISEDGTAMAKVQEMGYRQAPVVVAGEDHWSGFRPDKIKTLVAVAVA
jgi:glutaredoxin-like protein NrdH